MKPSIAEINPPLQTRLVRSVNDPSGPTVQLIWNDIPIGAPVPGALIAAQFQLEDGRLLLFLTADCPYEETLFIHLLSSDFDLLDSLELGGSYCSGVLEGIQPIDAKTIDFSFVHKQMCRIKIHDKPQFRWPRWIPGVKRKGALFRQYIRFQLIKRRCFSEECRF